MRESAAEFKIRSLEELCNKKHKISTAAVLCVQSVYLAVTFGSVCALVLVWNILSPLC
jgi:hypothetical protein